MKRRYPTPHWYKKTKNTLEKNPCLRERGMYSKDSKSDNIHEDKNKDITRQHMIAIEKMTNITVGVNKVDGTIDKNSSEDSAKHLVVRNYITTDNSDSVQINPLHA